MGSGQESRLTGDVTEGLGCPSEEFELYHYCYHLKAPGGKVTGILMSNINHVMPSLYFRGPWKSRQRMKLWTDIEGMY